MYSDLKEDIYFIVATYNAIFWIEKCLKGLNGFRVVVVDNNSADETVDYIQINFPEITVLKQKENLGFGKANNIGIEYALKQGCEYVFLLNQDAYLGKKTIPKLISIHKKNSNYGILSPLHLNGEGNRLDKMFSIYIDYNGNRDFYSDYILDKERREIYEVPFVNAAGWLLSRACIEKVGGFDPLFLHYGEDENYCQRVLYHNFKIGVVPEVYIKHDRENRLDKKRKKGNSEHFKRMEKELKIEFGNINKNFNNKLRDILQRRALSTIKSFVKLNIKDVRFYSKEYTILKRIIPQIEESRRINQNEKGAHLNIPLQP